MDPLALILIILVLFVSLGGQALIVLWVLRGLNHFNDWCTRLESRSGQSPGHPDGDGLADPFDPAFSISLEEVLEELEDRFVPRDRIRSRVAELRDQDPEAAVHLIVPLWNRAEHFACLLQQLKDHIREGAALIVHVADFGSDDIDVSWALEDSGLPYSLCLLEGPFARARAIDACLAGEHLPPSAPLLLCDVDRVYPAEVYEAARDAVAPGQRFWAPLVSGEDGAPLDGDHGFLATTRRDVEAAGGYGAGIYRYKRSRGGEDSSFARRLEAAGLTKLRPRLDAVRTRQHPRPAELRWYRDGALDFHGAAPDRTDAAPLPAPSRDPGLLDRLFRLADRLAHRLKGQRKVAANAMAAKRPLEIADPFDPAFSISLEEVLEELEDRFVPRDRIRSRVAELRDQDPEAAVHLIVPLWNRAEHFALLLDQLQEHRQRGAELVVHVGDFGSDDIDVGQALQDSGLPYCLCILEQPFAKARAMDACLAGEQLPDAAPVLMCDADMAFPASVYERIRSAVVPGRRFYCPLVAYTDRDGKTYGLDRDHGGHGFLATTRRDALAVGGYGAGIYRYKRTWGGEETNFAYRLEAAGLEKQRDVEGEVRCRYHERPADNRWYDTCSTRTFHGETRTRRPAPRKGRSGPPTITPILHAGLGNKLYQIACALGLAESHGARARFVLNAISEEGYERNKTSLVGRWSDFADFGGHDLAAPPGLPTTLAELFPRLGFEEERVEPRLLRARAEAYLFEEYNLTEDGFYDDGQRFPKVDRDLVIEGYFFSRRSYERHLPLVIDRLRPADSVRDHIDERYGALLAERPAALHLRFGYKRDHYQPLVPSRSWYRRALEALPKGPLVVCTDDRGRAEDFLKAIPGAPKPEFIEDEPLYVDLFVMARCAHLILSISSFGAWSATLGRHHGQRVMVHPYFCRKHGRSAPLGDWTILDDEDEPFQPEVYGAFKDEAGA